MHKRFYILLITLFTLIIGINVNALDIKYTNEVTNYKVVVEDDANLFSETEITRLVEKMEPLTEYGNIILKTINKNSYRTEVYADSYYHNNFSSSSGTLFLIDMYNRNIYIFSDGTNYRTITKAKANIITDNIYMYASRGDYYTCAYKAFDQIYTLLDGGKIAEPMRYISNALVSISLAFLISFIFVLVNTQIRKASNDEIIKNCDIAFEVNNIVGRKTGSHHVYSPRSDSSSGGHSSGGGGGGHSSGGGGGHSF